jgi:hypothetical protein
MTLANAADELVRHYAPNPEMLKGRIIDVRRICFVARVRADVDFVGVYR